MSPVLSIVTVSFNAREVIGKTLRSVTEQDWPAVEYIVIDGGSTDGTQEVIAPFRDRISHYVSEPDGGIYFGMNKGLDAATGDFVLFLNAGDVFADAGVLSDVAAFIARHPEAEVVYGDVVRIFEYGRYLIRGNAEGLTRAMDISHQATFIRTSLLKGHPFDTRYRYAADYEQVSSLYLEGHRFLHMDRTVSCVEMQDGATYRHYIESVNELYDIIEARGEDVSRERRSQVRRKTLIRRFRQIVPEKLRNPIFRWLAKHYKAL